MRIENSLRAAARHNFAAGLLEAEAAAASAAALAAGEKAWLTTSLRSGASCAMHRSKKASSPSTVSSLAAAATRCAWSHLDRVGVRIWGRGSFGRG